MKICFCSSLYLNEEKMIEKASAQLNISAHKLIGNIIEGFEDNMKEPNHLINISEVPSYPRYDQIVLKGKHWKHLLNMDTEDIEMGFLNIIGVKYVIQIILLVKYLKLWICAQTDDDLVICTYGRRFPHIIAINYIKKKYPKIITCMVLGDLSGKYAGDITVMKEKSVKALIFNQLLDYQVSKALNFDCFVLITEHMAQALKIKKPYCVMEGIGHVERESCKYEKKSLNKIVMYAGSLELQYSILDLVDAFKMIPLENYELWIYGSGSAEEKVKEEVKIDARIHFFGVVTSDKIKQAYAAATVLVNPRKNLGIYTKYSFPSKTMEYLASGKPVIGYKLDGIPEEYGDYLIYVNDNTTQELKKTIVEICEKTQKEREQIGKKGRDFISQHKNSTVQCKKIIELFNRVDR